MEKKERMRPAGQRRWKEERSDRKESWLNPSDAISAQRSAVGRKKGAAIGWRLSEGILWGGTQDLRTGPHSNELFMTHEWPVSSNEALDSQHHRDSFSSCRNRKHTPKSLFTKSESSKGFFHEKLIFYISISVRNLWIKAAWQRSRSCDLMRADRWRLSHSNTAPLRESLGKDIQAH